MAVQEIKTEKPTHFQSRFPLSVAEQVTFNNITMPIHFSQLVLTICLRAAQQKWFICQTAPVKLNTCLPRS